MNGFLVEVNDAMCLAAKVVEVLGLDIDNWQTMSAATEATACAYSWDDATDLFGNALLRIQTSQTAT